MTKYEKCLYILNNFRIICDARRKTITILWRYIHMAQIDRFYCEIVSKTIIPSNVCHRKTFTAFCHRKGFMGNYNVFFFHGSFSVRSDTKLFQTIYKRTFTVCFSVDQSIHKWHFTVFILFYFFTYLFFLHFYCFLWFCIWTYADTRHLICTSLYHSSSQYWTYFLSLLIIFWLHLIFNIRDQRRKEILLHLPIDYHRW